ncbi:acetate kinase [Mycoplasmopsis californica HAZ160_1]|uniref:Acetate kinase n=2 Tax=Mycoplasmopsis californica TaxID=2113 RepID=A0A059XQY4_9BACT|nr:acetate/propionate family kinase [Mycoplasmopsis californica]AIA29208.1 acetate kinase [Mycoplasmopsis californica]BAP01327.1 acetate kinase [Mycoplasmopsis californica HAZ160_1]BBG41201.1 acetate kinase [Mycoplasmopsis californica]BBG41794.1 acetate kinase [Mycoplasmopsis californica]BBG42388.1 acetate kinase [Mycoplasmopsis californica]
MQKILTVNAGSSSLKWALYSYTKMELLAKGICERIRLDGNIIIKHHNQTIEYKVDMPDHVIAVKELLKLWEKHGIIRDFSEILVVGFRTPYAGHKFLSPVIYTDEVKSGIQEAAKFIPLHAPATLDAVQAFQVALPNVTKVICQDTAFHTTIPLINQTFPINREWAEKFHIKKFGYHGLSHDYITWKMQKVLNKKKVNIVIAHLGSGSSICAVKDSKSYDVSVGFSSYDGLMMGTRPGGIDPGITDYLVRVENQDAQEVQDMMVKQSGLLGVSGISNDIRDLHKVYDKEPRAKLAIDIFVSRAVDYIASYLNKIGKNVDALVFTAGIGENDHIVRDMVVKGLHAYGIKVSGPKNNANYDDYMVISTPGSKFPIYKVRTDEEIVIARYAKKLIKSN